MCNFSCVDFVRKGLNIDEDILGPGDFPCLVHVVLILTYVNWLFFPGYSFCGHFLNPNYNIYENTSESGTRRSFKNGRLLEEIYNFKFLLDEQILEYQQENVCLVIKSTIIFTMIIYYNAFPLVAISSFWLPSAVHLSKKDKP